MIDPSLINLINLIIYLIFYLETTQHLVIFFRPCEPLEVHQMGSKLRGAELQALRFAFADALQFCADPAAGAGVAGLLDKDSLWMVIMDV